MKPIYPVNRVSNELERVWSVELAERFGQDVQSFLVNPTRFMQYPIETVRVELMDGSRVEFKYAFALVSEQMRAIAVFTEHCGHHVYPYHEARVYRAGQLIYANEA
jgi:hypothetical protein